MENAVPQRSYIILRKAKIEKTTATGISLPPSNEDGKQLGEVHALPKKYSGILKKGDKVAYSVWLYEDKNFVIVKEKDILAIL